MFKNFILLKFISKKKYAEEFLDGHIFLNTVDYYWNEFCLGNSNNVTGQLDLLEGTVSVVDVEKFGFDAFFSTDLIFRAVGYKYCNVACFYKLDYKIVGTEGAYVTSYSIHPKMKEFGEYVVVITDKNKFLRYINRVFRTYECNKYKYLCGEVNYHKLTRCGENIEIGHHIGLRGDFEISIGDDKYRHSIIEERDVFDKGFNYSYQNEWRIAMYRGKKDNLPYTLDIGNIRDIAFLCRVDELEKKIDEAFAKQEIKISKSGYYGNVDRNEMRRLFYRLGKYKAVPFGTMG